MPLSAPALVFPGISPGYRCEAIGRDRLRGHCPVPDSPGKEQQDREQHGLSEEPGEIRDESSRRCTTPGVRTPCRRNRNCSSFPEGWIAKLAGARAPARRRLDGSKWQGLRAHVPTDWGGLHESH